MYSKTAKISRHPKQTTTLFLFFLWMLIPGYGQGEVVDRIVAVVNDEVITLTDVNIIQKFGLFEDMEESRMRINKHKFSAG